MSQPEPIGTFLHGYARDTSRRITGKTLDDWDEVFRERRRAGMRSGHFRGGVMLVQLTEAQQMSASPAEANEIGTYCQRYGLAEDDLVVKTRVPVFAVVENRKRAGLPFPSIPVRKGINTETLIVLIVNPEKYP